MKSKLLWTIEFEGVFSAISADLPSDSQACCMDGFYGDVIVLAMSLLKGTVTELLVSRLCLPADQDILCVRFLMHGC